MCVSSKYSLTFTKELKGKKNEILQEMKQVRSQHIKGDHCSYLAWL